jgi:hypothetical protein
VKGCDYRRGSDWPLIHTPLVTTGNDNGVANPHTLQIARAHSKSSQFAFTRRFLVTDLNNGDSSASVLTSLLPGEYPATELGASTD